MPNSALTLEKHYQTPETNKQDLESMATHDSDLIKNLHSTVESLKMESSLINKNTEEIKRLLSMVDHLTSQVESLSDQIRIIFSNASDMRGLPGRPPVYVNQQPQAPVPMDAMEYSKIYSSSNSEGNYAGGSYAVIDPWKEKVSPSKNVLNPLYGTIQDDSSAVNEVEYLTTLSHRQVGVD